MTAAGGSGGYSYALALGSQPLPDGLSLAPDTGVISGTPTGAPGTYAFEVMVTDSERNTSTLAPGLTISAALLPTNVTPAPTLSQWALLLIVLALGGLGALGAHRKSQG